MLFVDRCGDVQKGYYTERPMETPLVRPHSLAIVPFLDGADNWLDFFNGIKTFLVIGSQLDWLKDYKDMLVNPLAKWTKKHKFAIYAISIMDFINRILQVLKEDLYWLRISTQDAGLIEPVKLWDEG